MILGSARALACWRWRLRHRELFRLREPIVLIIRGALRRGRRSVHATARALPGALRSRSLVAFAVTALAITISILCLPLPANLRQPCIGTLTLLDYRGREIAEIASPEARAQLPRRLDELGKWFPRVTVALEDHRFYEHAGVDWRATASACTRNLKAHRIVSGASTITQQLVKMASGRQRRSWFGKFYETIVAWKIERRWSKERILTEYLNRSSYGNRRLGPEAAARAYFGKSARDLTLAESIFLAGLPQAPTRFNPCSHPRVATRKYERSLAR
jgi:penicillin-binding protein 1C